MKHKYLVILIVFIFGFSPQKKDVQYNKINNQSLELIIKDFIKRGVGTNIGSKTDYLVLSMYHQDSCYHFRLRHAFDFDLLHIDMSAIMICKPILGKKIIFQNYLLDKFITGDKEHSSYVYKDDYPEIHKQSQERYKTYTKTLEEEELILDDDMPLIHIRELYFKFHKHGEFIDSTYQFYNRTKL